ncbi:condensation domain-containing protein, partial [Escherichia coli]|uniref:condensation domain-containing protein n=1 Tax=Escherichia coli TaxID=562 RepID=UPI00128F5149
EEPIPARHHWNQSILLAPRERLDARALKEALQALVAHHDVLRLRFEPVAGQWQAEFQAPGAEEVLWTRRLEDVGQLERIADDAQRSLSLGRGPLLRAL